MKFKNIYWAIRIIIFQKFRRQVIIHFFNYILIQKLFESRNQVLEPMFKTRRVTKEISYANHNQPRQLLGGSSRARKMVDKGQAPEQIKRNIMLAQRLALQSQTADISHNFDPKTIAKQISKQPFSQGNRLTQEALNKHDELAGKSSLQKKRLEKLLPNGSKKSALTVSDSTQQSSSNKARQSSKKSHKQHDMDSKSCKSFASTTTACTRIGKKRAPNQKIGDLEKSVRLTGKRQRLQGTVSPCPSTWSFAGAMGSPNKGELTNEQKQYDELIPLTKKNKPQQEPQQFKLWYERNLDFLSSKSKMLEFDLSKLEIEYDYDTDEEQIYRAKKMLMNETFLATEFYVKDDPFAMVENLRLKDYSQKKKH